MSGICPWCSAALAPDATVCPSCGANLVSDGDPSVPGVTAIDAAALVRSKATPQPRNRLLSWISGEYPADVPSKAEAQAIAPPDDEVRREILRLELEAQVANLQAEADAIRAEAVAEGRTIDLPETSPSEGAEAALEAQAEAGPEAEGETAPETAPEAGARAAAEAAEPAATTEDVPPA